MDEVRLSGHSCVGHGEQGAYEARAVRGDDAAAWSTGGGVPEYSACVVVRLWPCLGAPFQLSVPTAGDRTKVAELRKSRKSSDSETLLYRNLKRTSNL
jgi:hypothetical protein